MLRSQGCKNNQGFTIFELLVVVVVVAILAAIAVPGWLGYVERHRINKSRGEIYQGLKATRQEAVTKKLTWQMSFRQREGEEGEWAIHQSQVGVFVPEGLVWNKLESGVIFDLENTSFFKEETQNVTQWRSLFNHYGCPVYQPDDSCTQTSLRAQGTVTVRSRRNDTIKRCVIISTLLGALRRAEEQPTPNSRGRMCY